VVALPDTRKHALIAIHVRMPRGSHLGRIINNVAVWRYGRKAGVFEAADIREWRGHDVVDAQGHKIGELEAVYVDTGTDLPSFGTVQVGMPTRHRLVFVPLGQATVGPGTSRSATTGSRRSLSTTAWPTSQAAASGGWPAAEPPD
jgi:hypothetical protein